MPELTDKEAAILLRYIRDAFGLATDYATAFLEEAIRDKSGDEPSVWAEDGEGSGKWLPPEETSVSWNDAITGAVLVHGAAENRHIWDGLKARLKEQLEVGEEPPKWLLTWAAEAFAGIRRPPSGQDSGRGRATPSKAVTERAGHVVEILKSKGFTADGARSWITESLHDLWTDPESLRKALQRMGQSKAPQRMGQKSVFLRL